MLHVDLLLELLHIHHFIINRLIEPQPQQKERCTTLIGLRMCVLYIPYNTYTHINCIIHKYL